MPNESIRSDNNLLFCHRRCWHNFSKTINNFRIISNLCDDCS